MNRIHPLKSQSIVGGTRKTENPFLCLLPSAIWVYLHSAWMSPACSSDSWGGVRAFWCVWAALGTSQFPFPGSWDGGRSTNSNHWHVSCATTHRPVFGRGNGETKVWKNILGREMAGAGDATSWTCECSFQKLHLIWSPNLGSAWARMLPEKPGRTFISNISSFLPSPWHKFKDPFSKLSMHLGLPSFAWLNVLISAPDRV